MKNAYERVTLQVKIPFFFVNRSLTAKRLMIFLQHKIVLTGCCQITYGYFLYFFVLLWNFPMKQKKSQEYLGIALALIIIEVELSFPIFV